MRIGFRRIRWGLLAILWLSVGPVAAQQAGGDLTWLGQVREGDFTRETEAPNLLYGDAWADHHGARVDSFFLLGYDFGVEDGVSDFYAGSLQVPNAIPGLDFSLGRQWMNEGPGGAFVADGGKVTLDPGGPMALNVYAGAPRYFEPTFSSEIQSDDELLFGARLYSRSLRHTRLALGYQQFERDDEVLRQLVTATARRTLPSLPGRPDVYASFAWDAEHQDVDLGTVGARVMLPHPGLGVSVEGSYYRPQDDSGVLENDIDRREDPIFEVFALDEMVQVRSTLRYALTASLSTWASYGYQRYEKQPSELQHGHLGSVGLLWLPGGDGLETVRLEYYVIDSESAGHVDGGRVSYESRVYERLFYRARLDLAGIEKASNQGDVAISSLAGIGYEWPLGVSSELYLEANHNDRFDEDIRFGFTIRYNFRQALDRLLPGGAQSAGADPMGAAGRLPATAAGSAALRGGVS